MTTQSNEAGLIRPSIIAPTYNNAGTLPGILDRIDALGLPVFVVNDGSTDATASILERWSAAPGSCTRTVITHDPNQGKAAALQTGFAAAAKAGLTHTVTIDTDGQLDPEQIPDLLAIAREHPRALVIGARDDMAADYPARSRIGRRLSNLAIRLECGARVRDSQCGLRVYPLRLFEVVHWRSGRFAFEAEIITRAGWAGCEVISVPVTCRYFEGDQRVSHFHPWRDSLQGLRLHGRLLLRRLVPIAYPKCWE